MARERISAREAKITSKSFATLEFQGHIHSCEVAADCRHNDVKTLVCWLAADHDAHHLFAALDSDIVVAGERDGTRCGASERLAWIQFIDSKQRTRHSDAHLASEQPRRTARVSEWASELNE